jgi:glycosyltransferase involved in cell wall biosynthesis
MDSAVQPLISIIIPIYNEASHLKPFLKLIDDLEIPGCKKELVFIDDCSRDESLSILQKFKFQTEKVQILTQPINQGKGSALQKGFDAANGDFIVVQDADFEYDTEDLKHLVQPLLAGKADVVYGSRFKKSGTQVH